LTGFIGFLLDYSSRAGAESIEGNRATRNAF